MDEILKRLDRIIELLEAWQVDSGNAAPASPEWVRDTLAPTYDVPTWDSDSVTSISVET